MEISQGQTGPLSSWDACVQPSLHCRQYDLTLTLLGLPVCSGPTHSNSITSSPHIQDIPLAPGLCWWVQKALHTALGLPSTPLTTQVTSLFPPVLRDHSG